MGGSPLPEMSLAVLLFPFSFPLCFFQRSAALCFRLGRLEQRLLISHFDGTQPQIQAKER